MISLTSRSRAQHSSAMVVVSLCLAALFLVACGGEPKTVVVTQTITSTLNSTTTVEVEAPPAESSAEEPTEVEPEAPEAPQAAEAPTASVDVAAVRELLATLPIKGRAPKTGYDRKEFGQRWSDDVNVEFGHNGCDTRNDILNRDLTNVTYKPKTRDCVVLSGTLQDPYSAKEIEFQRGPESAKVQIDHVVALADAWVKGAQQLSEEERRNFANDPRNLLAVDGRLNQQKGAGDAATWLPPAKSFRCEYVSRQVEVKAAYRLWVTQAEYEAIDRVLNSCPQ